MSTKNQSSQKDNFLKNIIIDGEIIHHAFCIEGVHSGKYYSGLISKELSGNYKTPMVFESGIFTVDLARDITNLSSKRYKDSEKQIVILKAHSFNVESQNALLKTLEEPAPNFYIIIVVNKRDYLLPTVNSRVSFVKDGSINEELLSKAKKFSEMDLKSRLDFCESMAKDHEDEKVSRAEIANFIDLVVSLGLGHHLNSKKKISAIKNSEKIYSLLSQSGCSVKQALEAIAIVID